MSAAAAIRRSGQVADAAIAHVMVTIGLDRVRAANVSVSSAHQALPDRAHGAPPLHHQVTGPLMQRCVRGILTGITARLVT